MLHRLYAQNASDPRLDHLRRRELIKGVSENRTGKIFVRAADCLPGSGVAGGDRRCRLQRNPSYHFKRKGTRILSCLVEIADPALIHAMQRTAEIENITEGGPLDDRRIENRDLPLLQQHLHGQKRPRRDHGIDPRQRDRMGDPDAPLLIEEAQQFQDIRPALRIHGAAWMGIRT